MSYALEPLHSSPELIDDTIGLLKEEWPDCLAERLRMVETSQCKGLPCSLVLTESREGTAREVLGHVRIVRVLPESENRVYLESVAIKKSRQREGLGRNLHDLVGDYAKTSLSARYLHVTVLNEGNERFYRRLEYREYPVFTPQIAANVLKTAPVVTWEGNTIPEEWRYLYDGACISREEYEKADKLYHLVKDVEETTVS